MAKWRSKAVVEVEAVERPDGLFEVVLPGGETIHLHASVFEQLFKPCPVSFDQALAHLAAGGSARPIRISDGPMVRFNDEGRLAFVTGNYPGDLCVTPLRKLYEAEWFLA